MWPSVLGHSNEFAIRAGIQMSLLAGLGLTAVLGVRYPVKMVPLLLFELIWKTVYLVGFALPLWWAHRIDAATAADIASCLVVVIFVPLILWRGMCLLSMSWVKGSAGGESTQKLSEIEDSADAAGRQTAP